LCHASAAVTDKCKQYVLKKQFHGIDQAVVTLITAPCPGVEPGWPLFVTIGQDRHPVYVCILGCLADTPATAHTASTGSHTGKVFCRSCWMQGVTKCKGRGIGATRAVGYTKAATAQQLVCGEGNEQHFWKEAEDVCFHAAHKPGLCFDSDAAQAVKVTHEQHMARTEEAEYAIIEARTEHPVPDPQPGQSAAAYEEGVFCTGHSFFLVGSSASPAGISKTFGRCAVQNDLRTQASFLQQL
jgi:hypothetical protein